MRVYADVHLRVGAHLRQVHHLLPEGAAQHRRLSGAHHAQPQTAQLHVAAAHHHRGALAQTALLCGCFGDGPQYGAGLFYRGEDIGAQPGHVEQRRTPVAGEEIQHARRARIGRVHRQLAGELRRQPVADHGDGGGFTINIRTMVRQPQQARHGAEGKRLAGNVIHFGFKPVVVDLFEFSYLSAGAGVDVGAGPDSLAVAVVQHNPFAHRTAGDGLNIRRAQARALKRLMNTPAGQLPVGVEVELHRARHVLDAKVFPLGLANGNLVALQIENNGANAACPCI